MKAPGELLKEIASEFDNFDPDDLTRLEEKIVKLLLEQGSLEKLNINEGKFDEPWLVLRATGK